MTYAKQTWQDFSTGGTPISSDRLNHMEDGIEAASLSAVDAHLASAIAFTPTGNTGASTVQAAIVEVATDAASATSTVASDLAAHLSDATDAHDASAVSVLDAGGYYTGDDVEEVLAEIAPRAAGIFNVKTYGAVGDGTTDDTTAVQAAITAAAGGGIVWFPIGTYKITSALTITSNADTVGSPTWEGGGIHLRGASTKWSVIKAIGGITALDFTPNLSAFCSIENLTLLGPGSGTASSVAVDGSQTQSLNMRQVYIRDFETGIQAYDCTSWTLTNVRAWYCVTSARLGYNCDGWALQSCDFRNATTGFLIGWAAGSFTGASQFCNSLTFDSCIFAYSTVGLIVADKDASGISFFGSYFEGNTKDMEIGVNARGDLSGPSIHMVGSMHSASPSGTVAVGIDIYNRPALQLINCSTDGSNRYTVFAKLNDVSATQVVMDGCQINATTAAMQIGSRNYNTTSSNRESYRYLGAQTEMTDFGSFPASTPAKTNIVYNAGTDTVIERWGRSTTAGAVSNQFDLINRSGAILVATGVTNAFIAATSVSALPTASSVYRGCLAFVAGGAGVADISYVCLKSDADTYSWVAIDNNGLATRAQNLGGLPTGALAQSVPRNTGLASTFVLTSGVERLSLIWLDAGTVVSNITFVSGTTPLSVGTNQWFSLRSSARVLLGITADNTSTAWAANTAKTLALSTPYTVTVSGYYYIGVMVAATTPPHLMCATGVMSLAPIIAGTDATNTGLTTPATAPATSAALTAGSSLAYCYVS